MMKLFRLVFFALHLSIAVHAFSPPSVPFVKLSTPEGLYATTEESSDSAGVIESGEPKELIARRIVVEGDVQGGYYRSCVLNEVNHTFWQIACFWCYPPAHFSS
jgi:hypothetical protein